MLIVSPSLSIPESELSFTFVRSSGAGGQNVNKVNSKAQLRWSPVASASLPPDLRERFLARFGGRLSGEGDLIIVSDRFRDQARNRADCLEKLREMLLLVLRPPKRRKPTKPTRGARERRHKEKRQRSERKQQRRRFAGD